MSYFRPPLILLFALPLVVLAAAADPGQRAGSSAARARAESLLRHAQEQMGGAARWQAVRSLTTSGQGQQFLLERSERPEGPYIPEYFRFEELHDLAGRQIRQRRRISGWNYAYQNLLIASDSVAARRVDNNPFVSSPLAADLAEEYDLGPGRVLATALAAPDLRYLKDTLMQGVGQHVVAFSWRRWPVRLFLNQYTGLLTGREIVRPVNDLFSYQIWGDGRLLTLYSFWMLDPSGIRYPYQSDTYFNREHCTTALINELRLNAAAPADSFAVPPAVRQAHRAWLRQPRAHASQAPPAAAGVEIAPGIVTFAGRWNVSVVRQADGLVVLEAPVSSAYSAAVVARAQRQFPGLPVKAVVSTTDVWAQFGGLREYAARRVPIYGLDWNGPAIRRLLRAPFRTSPDSLQRRPNRRPRLHLVGSKTVLGSGPNRMELYPLRSEIGERMMLVYFPEHQLLYGSDLIHQHPGPAGGRILQYMDEFRAQAAALGLPVQRVFAMHSAPLKWADVQRELTPQP